MSTNASARCAACEGCAKVARHPGEGYVCARHPPLEYDVPPPATPIPHAREAAQAIKACISEFSGTRFMPPEKIARLREAVAALCPDEAHTDEDADE